MAGWYWWDKLREQYILSWRTPPNLSICRVLTVNIILLNEFYKKVVNLLTKLDL